MLNKPKNPSPFKTTPDFWRLLRIFWDEDRVEKWKNKIFPDPQNPDTGVESCFGLICLEPTTHVRWTMGLFALKPLKLSDDKKKLDIQFFWQCQYSHQPADCIDLLKEPNSSKGLSQVEKLEPFPVHGERQSNPYYIATSQPRLIQSGDVFTLTTDDPNLKPLPCWELLEMQWFLQRLTAMSGAAGMPNIDWNDDVTMSSCPMLIPDDNDTIIGPSFEQVYEWIPPPLPMQDNMQDMARVMSKVQYEPNLENRQKACHRCAKTGRQCTITTPTFMTAGGL